jgi:hypothetical protein
MTLRTKLISIQLLTAFVVLAMASSVFIYSASTNISERPSSS